MATSTTISGLTALGAAPSSSDLLVLVDVSDTTQSPSGTTKHMTVANLFTSPSISAPTLTGTTTAGALTLSGDLAIATTKFTVAAASGNTVIAGTLGVTGAGTFASVATAGNISQTLNNAFLIGKTTGGSAVSVIGVDAADHVIIDNSGLGAKFNGGVTIASGLTVTAGGAIITAGNLTVTAGNATITAGDVSVAAGHVTVGSSSAKNLVVAGGGAAIATNATVGFLMTSSCSGTPTGAPASIPTGTVPMIVDTGNSRVWFYISGVWKGTAVLT